MTDKLVINATTGVSKIVPMSEAEKLEFDEHNRNRIPAAERHAREERKNKLQKAVIDKILEMGIISEDDLDLE